MKNEPSPSTHVPAIRQIARADVWAAGWAASAFALGAALIYMVFRFSLNLLGVTSSARSPREVGTLILGVALVLLVPLLGAFAVRVRAIRRAFRHGERRPGTTSGFSEHQGFRIAVSYTFHDGTRPRQATARPPSPRLVSPNPLDRFAEQEPVTVVVDPRNPARTFLAEMYLDDPVDGAGQGGSAPPATSAGGRGG